MAQTGYTPILIYSSSTASNAPAAGNLTNSTLGSELAINITDGKLFYKDNANAIQVIGWKTTPTTAGGTGLTSYTAGDLLYYASGTTLSKLGIGSSKTILTSSGTAPQWSASLDTSQGGTGVTSYTAGDLTYYASGTALSKLGIGAANTVLTSSGTAPQWTTQSSLAVGTASNLKSNATTGVMQIVGPAAAATRVMTIPDANFTVARTDAGNAFTGNQTISGTLAAGGVAITGYQYRFTGSTSAVIGAESIGVAVDNTIAPPVGGYNASNFYIAGIITRPSGSSVTDATGLLLAAPTLDGSGTALRGTTLRISGAPTGATTNRALWVQAGSSEFGADVTLTSANLVQGTAAKGINFTANSAAAGMTSQLLNWYEEGTFTCGMAASTSGTITLNASYKTGRYTRIGRQVTVCGFLVVSSVSSPVGSLTITGLPYANGSNDSNLSAFPVYATGLDATATTSLIGRIGNGATALEIALFAAGSSSNAAGKVLANAQFTFMATYFVS
jgi:hypothetical protein